MTFVVFVAALLCAATAWSFGVYALPVFGTIYVAAFMATLSTAVVFAIRSGRWRNRAAAAVAVVSFATGHFVWGMADPVGGRVFHALFTAGWFILAGKHRWELVCGGLYLTVCLAAIGTLFGLVPSHLQRAPVFLAFSLPDIVALAGHGANIAIGAGSGDGGSRILSFLTSRFRGSGAGGRILPRGRARLEMDKSGPPEG